MASILNMAPLTFTAEQVRDINNLVFEKTYKNPDLLQFVNVMTNMKSGKLVGYIGLMGQVGKSGTLGCDPDSSTRTAATSQVTWAPGFVSDRISQCYDDLVNNATRYAMENGVKIADLTGTDWMVIIVTLLGTTMDDMIHRIAWFADTDAANLSDTPDGTITNGVDVNLLNPINGYWKQLFTIGTNDSTKRVSIAKNAQGTYAHQKFDSTDTTNKVATGILQDLIFNADMRLRAQNDLVILCTQSIYDQYTKELGSYGTLESSFATLQNGQKVLKINGTPIVPYHTWDRMIKSFYDNGVYVDKPHRAVLISKSSTLWLGLEDETAYQDLDMFYDKKSRTNFIDFEFMIDVKIPETYLVEVAY